jgi:hypothetical protein
MIIESPALKQYYHRRFVVDLSRPETLSSDTTLPGFV